MAINPYEKMIMIMRDQSKTDPLLFTGEIMNAGKCAVGDLVLKKTDYATLGNLSLSKGDTVLICALDDRYIVMGKVVE